MDTDLKITGTYSNGCFCERMSLQDSKPFNPGKRFQFRQRAADYAALNGLVNLTFSSKDKVAFAELTQPCRHHDRQYVRIEWTLWYVNR